MRLIKVNALPSPAEPNTMYFVRNGETTTLTIVVTDSLGEIAYSTGSPGEVIQLIAALRNQANGVAGIDGNRILCPEVYLSGQNSLFVNNSEEPVWDDIVAHFDVKDYSSANAPAFEVFTGNIHGPVFRPRTMNQAWCDFHIRHDIALGTKLYPHIHWAPMTNNLGRVRFGIEYTVAKGHGQQAFPSSTTVYVEHEITSPSDNVHFITETSEATAIPSTDIEPDTVIKVRVFRDGANSRDTHNYKIHAWCCDLHYQKTRFGTINKAPNFYL